MRQKIYYDGPLTGTLAEAAEREPLGIPYPPLQQMWQVNPPAEAVDPADPAEKQAAP
jgi:hypothetical protein